MMELRKIELLAPAKDKDTAFAAINYGCDALYIGASNFGARKNVPNSLDDIKEIVDYAHRFYVKVHVTINTILTDEELIKAEKLINDLYKIGVDAIIVQDMGIIELAVKGKFPPIPIHASTQCDNRTLEKIKFFNDLGITRVILARELSLEKIEDICNNSNLEVETFIHGALCVSYSGQCYLSHSIGGRSANRGECAQPCRKKYTLVDEDGNVIAKDKHLLSLRDFNASKHIDKLVQIGVKSFKIEGRLKDENYVKNVVAFYRKELDKTASRTSSGKVFLDFEPDVNKSFNRGFTDYFLEDRKRCFNFSTPKAIGEKLGKVKRVEKDYFVLNSDLNAQDGLCYFVDDELQGCLVNKVEGNKIYPNRMGDIKAGTEIFRNFDCKFDRMLTNSKTKRRIKVNFQYKNSELYVIDEDNNSVSVIIKSEEVPNNPEKMSENFINQLKKTGESDFYTENIEIFDNLPFMPVSQINELRRNILDKLMYERLKNYKRQLQTPLNYASFPVKDLDYRTNIHNETSKCFYENCGCEICEMSLEHQSNSGIQPFHTVKTDGIELMRTKHCLKFAFNMCKSPKKLFLIDEKGKKYKLKFDCKNCEMVLLK